MATDTPTAHDGWAAADALEQRLAEGGDLLQLDSPVPLLPDETLHAGIEAQCAWFGPAEVTYSQQRLLIFDTASSLALSAAASAIGNRRRRRTATSLTAPQWHALGPTQVLLTSHRLLVEIDGDLRSLPLTTIAHLVPAADPGQLTIAFMSDTAVSLHGTWTRYLAIALAAALANRDV